MDHGDVGDGGILGQCLVDLIWIEGITLATVDDRVVDGQHLRDPSDTPPIGAVGQDEQLVITSDGVPTSASTANVPLPCISTLV